MSKLSFRARALDVCKPMPLYHVDELPDLPDFSAINRAVPPMPTGMEKEEECEHHLQRVISSQQAFGRTAGLVIPTPEVISVVVDYRDIIYREEYKQPRQLIHVQPYAMDQDFSAYDMDSDDEKWFSTQPTTMTEDQFESIMERLEKSSGQQVATVQEAKLLCNENEDLVIAVYDYWLTKRLTLQHALIPQVKTERRDGTSNSNPYVAFRRRTEKMQTRKNRKNDESSYEKMLKLHREFLRVAHIFELVKKREHQKRDFVEIEADVLRVRYKAEDFNGQLYSDALSLKSSQPSSNTLQYRTKLFPPKQDPRLPLPFKADEIVPKKKREYNKRRFKARINTISQTYDSSEEEDASPVIPHSDLEEENDPDGVYAFKRKRHCNYLAPRAELGNLPWEGPVGGKVDKRFKFNLISISHPKTRRLGFGRRRIGRGGRIILDRAYTPLDNDWDDILHDEELDVPIPNKYLREVRNDWPHFSPRSPPRSPEFPDMIADSARGVFFSSALDVESYQTHQEELFEMQRKQLERLKQTESTSPSPSISPPSSTYCLDPSKVQFAVSALRNANEVSPQTIALTRPTVLANGPAKDGRPEQTVIKNCKEESMKGFPLIQIALPTNEQPYRPSSHPDCVTNGSHLLSNRLSEFRIGAGENGEITAPLFHEESQSLVRLKKESLVKDSGFSSKIT